MLMSVLVLLFLQRESGEVVVCVYACVRSYIHGLLSCTNIALFVNFPSLYAANCRAHMRHPYIHAAAYMVGGAALLSFRDHRARECLVNVPSLIG